MIPEFRNFEILGFRNVGILEYQNFGIFRSGKYSEFEILDSVRVFCYKATRNPVITVTFLAVELRLMQK